MPSLKAIRASVSDLPKGSPLVVALVGGTTGIGSYIALALATTFAKDGSKLRVYIIGRNAARADSVISEANQISPGSDWRFLQASDLSLIREVDRCCEDLIQQETEDPFHGGSPRLDLLYMTHSHHIMKERQITPEGLDAFISTIYYSRIRFTMQLIPLLTTSPLPGHVISVYAGGFEDGTKPGEWPVGCPPDASYGIGAVRKNACFMKTFLFEDLAERYAGKLSLTHIYPGLVNGPAFNDPDVPTKFKIAWRVIKPLLSWYMTSPADCGQVMVYLATSKFSPKGIAKDDKATMSTDGEPGGGAYGVGQRADPASGIRYEKLREEGVNKKIWDHTMETLEEAKKKGLEISQE